MLAEAAASVIVFATFNVRVPVDPAPNDWASRRPRVREVVAAGKFDVFGVQEAVLEQVSSIAEDTGFARIGGGRDDFAEKGEHCCIFYRKERFELLDGGTFGLSKTPGVPGVKSWGSACPRIATWGRFRDKTTGREFCFYNTHLDHVSEEARSKGIELVVAHAAENCKDLPIVLTGDFNAYPDSDTYKRAAALLRDAKSVSESGHGGPELTFQKYGGLSGKRLENPQPIDYIFVSSGVRVLSHVTMDAMPGGAYASDHFPVVAGLVMP